MCPAVASQPRRTFRLAAFATRASFQGPMPPTNTAALMAMHRCPAAPKAAPASALTVASRLASGMMTAWFLAPRFACAGMQHDRVMS